MRVIYAGTPEFAVPTLEALVEAARDVVLVVTQPDRPAGRGRKLTASPVKAEALRRGLCVFQPDDVNAPESLSLVRQLDPDVMVVQAFGQKLGARLLAVPRLGCLNVHASLLPAYRGAAPVNWALIHGERVTGVTVIRMNERIDAGEVLARESVAIRPDWSAGDLAEVLAELGAKLMVSTLREVEAGTAKAAAQDASKVSKAPRLEKHDGLIPWDKRAREVHNHIRGMTPWPGAFTFFADVRTGHTVRLTVLRSSVAQETGPAARPGTVLDVGSAGPVVACGEGSLRLDEVKPSGGRAMTADAFARGHAVRPGMRFEDHE